MSTSSSGSGIAGESYSLTCSATLVDPVPLPSDIPTPNFEWFFGPHGNASLPSGAIPMATILQNGHTYSSSLHFSPLSQCHTGMYTCRLGVGILATSTMIIVNGKKHNSLSFWHKNHSLILSFSSIASNISVQIITSGSSVLGESGFTLSCCVSGADHLNPFITYQWTMYNGSLWMQIQDGPDPRTISFAPLRVADAGKYTCQATIRSTNDDSSLIRSGSRDVMVSSK